MFIGRLKRKICESRAFTLAETLVAVLILLLVSVVVAAGIPAASTAYDNVVVASNAEVLMSTAMLTLRNEVGTGRDFEVSSDNKSMKFYNESYGTYSEITKVSSGNKTDAAYFYRYASDDLLEDAFTETSRPSELAATRDLYVSYGEISGPDNGIITFSDLTVRKKKTGEETPAHRDTLSIRVITE